MDPVAPDSPRLYQYIGLDGGQGMLHRIIHSRNGEVVTVTNNLMSGEKERTWSWFGTVQQFEKNFIPVPQAP